jgi:hypothetical protein
MALRRISVVEILSKTGPATTSEIAARLREKGRSAQAARQSVSRLPQEVRALRGIRFPKGARFLYLKDQFGSGKYWTALISAIKNSNPAYAAALAGLQSRGGAVPRYQFDIVSGSPVRQKGQIASSAVLDHLLAAELVSLVTVEGLGECILLRDEAAGAEANLRRLRARLLTESVLVDAIRGWAGRMNMASPLAATIRAEGIVPQFATFCFDLCGPSYLHPLVRSNRDRRDPGFLVADIIVGRELDEAMVGPFLRKCRLLANLKKVRPFLPLLIADAFTPEALRQCRSRGIMATRPDTLVGQAVARALGELLQTLSNAAAVAAAHPDRIENLFERLSAVEGSAGNLRGALFELLVGHVVRAIEGGSIDIGVLVIDQENRRRAEIDVRLIKERHVTIYECRGYQPSAIVSRQQVEDWLHTRIPTIYRAHRQEERFQDSQLRFELWTSAVISTDALVLLQQSRANTRKYEIAWKDGPAVRDYSQALKAPGIRKILNEHYFEHPLRELNGSPHPSSVSHEIRDTEQAEVVIDEAVDVN